MDLRSRFSRKMAQGLLGGLFLGMGILEICEFFIYEIEFGFLVFGIFVFCLGAILYWYWDSQISGIVKDIEREFGESREKLKIGSAAQPQGPEAEGRFDPKLEKRIFREDLCYEIKVTPGSRDSKPLMIVAFKKASNYTPDTHEWVPKLSELKFLEQTLKRIAQPG